MEKMIEEIESWAKTFSLPDSYYQLCDLLQTPDVEMADIALLIGRDRHIAERFLDIINTPLYRQAEKVTTVSQGLSQLSSQQVQDLILCASLLRTFDDNSNSDTGIARFWQRTVYCAATARQLAVECEYSDSERMFTLGLLHDMGHLFLIDQHPEVMRRILMEAHDQRCPVYLIEQQQLGFDHTEMTGLIMKTWNLPKDIRIPVTAYLEPEKAHKYTKEASMLHLASLSVQYDLEEGAFSKSDYDKASIEKLTHLIGDCCQRVRALTGETHKAIISQLFKSSFH